MERNFRSIFFEKYLTKVLHFTQSMYNLILKGEFANEN